MWSCSFYNTSPLPDSTTLLVNWNWHQLFLFLLTIGKSSNLKDVPPCSSSSIPVSISGASEEWTPAQTHTHIKTAGGAHCWLAFPGCHHHSGSTATWNRVAAVHNVRQHNGAEQDTMFPCTEPKQLIWRRRQMVVSKQVIDWTRLAIRSLVLFSSGQKVNGVPGLKMWGQYCQCCVSMRHTSSCFCFIS